MTVRDLPALNAALNATATVLLFVGWRFILRGQRDAHMRSMVAAFGVSVAFLASYLVYHASVGSVPFPGTGLVRTAYLTMLATHVVLAAIVPPLALVTLWRAYRGDFERHRWIARITFPIWMYVSVTGVIVYVVLYWIYEAVPA
ncbi:MAG: DUF420 domain-containing protein [Candidatus Binatia bacterium]